MIILTAVQSSIITSTIFPWITDINTRGTYSIQNKNTNIFISSSSTTIKVTSKR
jgi:hypothetical protein